MKSMQKEDVLNCSRDFRKGQKAPILLHLVFPISPVESAVVNIHSSRSNSQYSWSSKQRDHRLTFSRKLPATQKAQITRCNEIYIYK